MKENQFVEFKESWRDDYLKILSAFANTDGGVLYIGISDKGEVIGVSNLKHLLESLPNKIRNSLNTIPSVKIEDIEGKDIIKIEVSPSEVPISYPRNNLAIIWQLLGNSGDYLAIDGSSCGFNEITVFRKNGYKWGR